MPMKAKAQTEEPERPASLDAIDALADELIPHASTGVLPHLLGVKAATNRARAAQKVDQSLIRPAPRIGSRAV